MMEANIRCVIPHAITIHVNDLYKWLELVTIMEKATRLKYVFSNREVSAPKWIYRGQANSEWKISSSFERQILPLISEEVTDKEDALRTREKSAIIHFRQWASIPKQNEPSTEGEWLALMQHYLVPTRLIDFTEVPLFALGFALEDKTQKEADFAVWAVRRNFYSRKFQFNQVVKHMRETNDRPSSCEILETPVLELRVDDSDRHTRARSLGNLPTCELGEPDLLRYIPMGMNDRQKRQKGLFLASTHLSKKFMPLLHKWTLTNEQDLHDKNLEMDVDDTFASNGLDDNVANAHIIKYVFKKDLRSEVDCFLRCCNINALTRYGGLEKLAEETAGMFKEGF